MNDYQLTQPCKSIPLILRYLNKIRNAVLPPYSKFHLILLIIILGCIIRTSLTHRRSPVPIDQSDQNQQRAFQCRSRWKLLTFFSSFYDVYWTNPFLQALVNNSVSRVPTDVCTNFDPLYTRIATDFRSFQPFQLSDFDGLHQACPQCHHLQIIDGKLRVIRRSISSDFQTRSRSVKALFQYVVDTFDHIPNIEFLFHVGDAVGIKINITHPSKCPIFGFARKVNNIVLPTYSDGVVTIPCFSFWNWTRLGVFRLTLQKE